MLRGKDLPAVLVKRSGGRRRGERSRGRCETVMTTDDDDDDDDDADVGVDRSKASKEGMAREHERQRKCRANSDGVERMIVGEKDELLRRCFELSSLLIESPFIETWL